MASYQSQLNMIYQGDLLYIDILMDSVEIPLFETYLLNRILGTSEQLTVMNRLSEDSRIDGSD